MHSNGWKLHRSKHLLINSRNEIKTKSTQSWLYTQKHLYNELTYLLHNGFNGQNHTALHTLQSLTQISSTTWSENAKLDGILGTMSHRNESSH